MNIRTSVDRLEHLLPLGARQGKLPVPLKKLHRKVLFALVERGLAPNRSDIADLVGEGNIDESLQRLCADDLIVLDSEGKLPVGAYPVTIVNTPHAILVNGNIIHAMCALDALSVAPVFDVAVVIDSVCHVSQTPVHIRMQGSHVVEAQPSADVTVGIRWQKPSAVAAHSLCMEMVFLKDRKIAETWQSGDTDNISLYTLSEAVEFGKAFFLPLIN